MLPTLERWTDEGLRAAVAILIGTEGSAPLEPGAAFAVSERGDVAGTVTGGCVEPALYEEAQAILAGAPARRITYGVADEEAFEVGLPCGGTVHVFVTAIDPALVRELAAAVADERPVALEVPLDGAPLRLVPAEDASASTPGLFVLSVAPPPRLFVVGAIDHAAALAAAGRLLGYRVTVCDPRPRFLTRERFPAADELAVDWPDRVLARETLDERSAVCVLTHDPKLDVPALRAALASPAGYVGAMGGKRTTAARLERLRGEGVSEEDLARIHAPIGLDLGAKTPAEVAVAVAAELVALARVRTPAEATAG